MSLPADLKYTKDNEWVRIEGDIATVGITDFAQGELGDVVFVELPKSGDSFSQGDNFGTIEAVKTVADLFMPISGKILEINTKLDNSPHLINEEPYVNGWIVKISINNASEIDELLSSVEYQNSIK